MEDVEQRLQRLAAMRQQAQEGSGGPPPSTTSVAAAGSHHHHQVLPPSPLEAPEGSGQEEVPGVKKASGFDFYTDPLASYSASSSAAKRRRPAAPILQQPSNPSHHPNPGFLSPPTPLPPRLPHGAQFHHQPGALGQFPRPNPTPAPPIWQPVPYQPPPETMAPPPPAFAHHAQDHMYPQPPSQSHQFMNQFPQQAHGRGRESGWHRGGGGGRAGQSRGVPPSGSSRGGLGFSGSDGVTGGGRGSFSSRSGPGPGKTGRSPAGGFWSGHDNNYNNRGIAGRGQGRGRGGGGGRAVSAKEQPHLFLKRSMVEDPWQAFLIKTDGK